MGNSYDEFLCRLTRYRENVNLTQKDVSKLFGKDQSQFSKMELGKTVVPFEVLQGLKDAGWDIDYIITGREKIDIKSNFTHNFEEKNGKQWAYLKEVLIWILGHELNKNNSFSDEDTKSEYELLKQLLYTIQPGTTLLAVRNMLGISQITMSEKLGVNIKKYCQLEKGTKKPDAELLGMIYELAHCRPGIFMCQGEVSLYLIDCLWNRMEPWQQEEAATFLNYTISI